MKKNIKLLYLLLTIYLLLNLYIYVKDIDISFSIYKVILSNEFIKWKTLLFFIIFLEITRLIFKVKPKTIFIVKNIFLMLYLLMLFYLVFFKSN